MKVELMSTAICLLLTAGQLYDRKECFVYKALNTFGEWVPDKAVHT